MQKNTHRSLLIYHDNLSLVGRLTVLDNCKFALSAKNVDKACFLCFFFLRGFFVYFEPKLIFILMHPSGEKKHLNPIVSTITKFSSINKLDAFLIEFSVF